MLFLPWVGSFLYQGAHTGTPWGAPFRPTAIVQTTLMDMGGGTVTEASLYGSVVLVLVLLGVFVARAAGHTVELDVRTVADRAVGGGGLGRRARRRRGGRLRHQRDVPGALRGAVVPLVLLAVAVGLTRLPGRAALVAGGVFVGLSLFGVVWVNYFQRTQSAEVAAAVRDRAEPGDVVVYCPDQLGPAYSREMPDDVVELAYPVLDAPERVDWVDYAERNGAADPKAIADDILAEAGDHADLRGVEVRLQHLRQAVRVAHGALGRSEALVQATSTGTSSRHTSTGARRPPDGRARPSEPAGSRRVSRRRRAAWRRARTGARP